MDKKAMEAAAIHLNQNVTAKQLKGIHITRPAVADWCSVCNKEAKTGRYYEITISNSVFRLCVADAQKLSDIIDQALLIDNIISKRKKGGSAKQTLTSL